MFQVEPCLTLSCDLLRLPDVNVRHLEEKLHRSQQTVGDVRQPLFKDDYSQWT